MFSDRMLVHRRSNRYQSALQGHAAIYIVSTSTSIRPDGSLLPDLLLSTYTRSIYSGKKLIVQETEVSAETSSVMA